MDLQRPPVERRVIDGTIAFITRGDTEEANCGLVVGAGSADETLARSCWLLLALKAAGTQLAGMGVRVRIQVEQRLSIISIHGPALQAAEALARLCRILPRPDHALLPTLHAEQAASPKLPTHNPINKSLHFRFGFQGPGVASNPYHGALQPTSYQGIEAAADRWFARENCRLFFDFEPPPGWAAALPPGGRLHTPAPDYELQVPGWFDGVPSIVVSGVVGRGDATTMFAELARRDLERFSDPQAAPHLTITQYLPFTADQSVIVIQLRRLGETAIAEAGEVAAAVKSWQQGFDRAAIDAARAAELEQFSTPPPPALAASLAAQADLELPPGESNYWRPHWTQVSDTQLRRVAEDFNRTLLIGVPTAAHGKATGLDAATFPTRYVADLPERHRSINHPVDERIAGIKDGRLWIADEAYPASSVNLERLAVIFKYPDGALSLLDDHAQGLVFDPLGWRDGQALRDHLLASTDPAIQFEGRQRTPEEQRSTHRQLTKAELATAMTAKRLDEAKFGRRADFVEMLIALSCVLPLVAGIVAIEVFGVSPALAMGLGIPAMFLAMPVVIIAAKARRKRKYRARAHQNAAELAKRPKRK